MRIKIHHNGALQFLYDDNSPFLGLGEMRVQRASNVEFDIDLQRWIVYVPERGTDGPPVKMPGEFKRRADAIEAEKKYLEEKMVS